MDEIVEKIICTIESGKKVIRTLECHKKIAWENRKHVLHKTEQEKKTLHRNHSLQSTSRPLPLPPFNKMKWTPLNKLKYLILINFIFNCHYKNYILAFVQCHI